MSAVINTNIASLNTQRNLASSKSGLETSIQRLSSGLRVNSAKDDASGLSVATKMDAQIRGMNVAIRNSNDAVSYAQTADGGLSKINDSLQRMRELAVQGANATTDNGSLTTEFKQLQDEITRVTDNTKFNTKDVLKASADTVFQVGAGTTTADQVALTATNLTSSGTGSAVATAAASASASVSSAASSKTAIDSIDAAISAVNTARADVGAAQNRFESIVSNLQVSVESQSAAKSRIMDTDFAEETAKLTRGQILQQAGTAMLAQANSAPNGVLALLRG
ncbi:MAG: flagellin FliC [Methylophilaceae bacterium]|nr:flagellin FliC [Methylophilaceae bacterium]